MGGTQTANRPTFRVREFGAKEFGICGRRLQAFRGLVPQVLPSLLRPAGIEGGTRENPEVLRLYPARNFPGYSRG